MKKFHIMALPQHIHIVHTYIHGAGMLVMVMVPPTLSGEEQRRNTAFYENTRLPTCRTHCMNSHEHGATQVQSYEHVVRAQQQWVVVYIHTTWTKFGRDSLLLSVLPLFCCACCVYCLLHHSAYSYTAGYILSWRNYMEARSKTSLFASVRYTRDINSRGLWHTPQPSSRISNARSIYAPYIHTYIRS